MKLPDIITSEYSLSNGSLKLKTKQRMISEPRMVLIHFLVKHQKKKVKQIAKAFDMTKSGVYAALQRFDDLQKVDKRFNEKINNIKNQMK